MAHVVTLAVNPASAKLTQATVDAVRKAVSGGSFEWLAEGIACDIAVESAPDTGAIAKVLYGSPVSGEAVDFIAQPASARRKELLISDMDSTMITIECIDELADFIGKKPEVARITERAMNGELNFERALVERVRLLKGLPEEILERCYRERVQMMPGARALVATMRSHGARCVLVSGGFTYFTKRVAEQLGFHEDRANVLEVKDGKLTGEVLPPILGKEAKLEALKETMAQLGSAPERSLAVGDGANDLPMLLEAGLGVAYHAKPSVQASARAKLNHCDLSALLYAQGYRQEEILFEAEVA